MKLRFSLQAFSVRALPRDCSQSQGFSTPSPAGHVSTPVLVAPGADIPSGRLQKLFDVVRSFFEAVERFRVVLDPELRAALLEVCFHCRTARRRLFPIRLRLRNLYGTPLFRIVP
jgi:hypothetical protein